MIFDTLVLCRVALLPRRFNCLAVGIFNTPYTGISCTEILKFCPLVQDEHAKGGQRDMIALHRVLLIPCAV